MSLRDFDFRKKSHKYCVYKERKFANFVDNTPPRHHLVVTLIRYARRRALY